MSGNLLALDRKLLANHPSALHRSDGAALPLPEFDPNPRLTMALHDLWAVVLPFVTVEDKAPAFAGPPANELSLAEALKIIGPSLVSHGFSFHLNFR